jgi:hypothetical protein
MEAKSQLFLKYFTLFMNLLNDCGEAGGAVLAGSTTLLPDVNTQSVVLKLRIYCI